MLHNLIAAHSNQWNEGLRDGQKCERCQLEVTGNIALFREYMRIIEGRMAS